MGTTLTGTKPKDTYDSLIKVTDNGPLSGTAKYLSDGLGNDSAFALSTTQVGVGAPAPAITTAKLTVGGQLTNTANLALQLFKTGTPQILSGDVLGNIWFVGIDNDITTGTNNIGARISAVATTNWTTDGTTSNTALTFHTHGTTAGDAPERMRITSEGVVELAQGQIKFPATQVASADANTLDDYEEGTWTPVFAQGGTNNTATYSYQLGTYTKVGNLVTVFFDIEASSITAGSGACSLKGLPFTVGSSMAGYSCVNTRAMNVFNGYLTNALATGFVEKSSTYIALQQVSTTTGQETSISTYASSGRATGIVQYTV